VSESYSIRLLKKIDVVKLAEMLVDSSLNNKSKDLFEEQMLSTLFKNWRYLHWLDKS